MTVREVSSALGIALNQTYEAIHRGEIPSIRIGRRLVVPKVAFERMLAGDVAARIGHA